MEKQTEEACKLLMPFWLESDKIIRQAGFIRNLRDSVIYGTNILLIRRNYRPGFEANSECEINLSCNLFLHPEVLKKRGLSWSALEQTLPNNYKPPIGWLENFGCYPDPDYSGSRFGSEEVFFDGDGLNRMRLKIENYPAEPRFMLDCQSGYKINDKTFVELISGLDIRVECASENCCLDDSVFYDALMYGSYESAVPMMGRLLNLYQKNNAPPHLKRCGLIGACF